MGWLWHLLAGTVLGTAASFFAPFWLAPIAIAIYGVGREMLQHGTYALSLHQNLEGWAWPVGALVGGALATWMR